MARVNAESRRRRQAVNGTAQLLVGQLETIEADLNAELRSILNDPRWRYRQGRIRGLLNQINAAKIDITAAGQAWVNGPFRAAYAQSATDAAARLGAEFAWTQFHREGFTALATDTFGDVLDVTRHMGDDVKALIRESAKAAAVTGEVAGRTALQSADAMAADLRLRGITAVTYRNGAKHGIGSFSRMLMRTKTALARNLGEMIQFSELGVETVEIVDSLDCGLSSHDDPERADGLILPLAEASAYPISHPGCVRSFLPRPDVKAADTKRAESLVPIDRWEDQRRFEAYLKRERLTREGRVMSRTPRSGRNTRTGRTNRMSPTEAELRSQSGRLPTTASMPADTQDFWTRGGKLHPDRQALHDEIRAGFTDNIPVMNRPAEFHMTGGGPASGKSSMLQANPDGFPAADVSVHVDPDAVKELLPEYRIASAAKDPKAAAFVHEESSAISKLVIRDALENGQDILYDSTGDSGISKLAAKIDEAHDAGHRVIANYATNDVRLAERIAVARGKATGRVVPVKYIRATHTDVTDTFLDAVDRGLFDEAHLWDTNIENSPREVLSFLDGRVTIHDSGLFADFVAKGSRSLDEVMDLLEPRLTLPDGIPGSELSGPSLRRRLLPTN